MFSQPLTASVQALIPDARIETLEIPNTGVSLFLINEDYPQHALPSEVAHQLMEQPLYWAFCWASGAVLATYIRNNPTLVKDKRVIDFGSGSGIVAIAAAKAGARCVVACDRDSNALLAIKENADLNKVELDVCADFDQIKKSFDLLTAADVLYDRENFRWLDKFNRKANSVLLADSRIKNFDHPGYSRLGQFESCTLPDLDESKEFRVVSVYKSSID